MKRSKFVHTIEFQHIDGTICSFQNAYLEEKGEWIIIHCAYLTSIKIHKKDIVFILLDDKYYYINENEKEKIGTVFVINANDSAIIFKDDNGESFDTELILPNKEKATYNDIVCVTIFSLLGKDKEFNKWLKKKIEQTEKEIKDEN